MCKPVFAAAAGFTLIEVLIATLVLALGLVGGVGMQLHALRTRYESAQLSRAVHLASGMAERIRANGGQVGAYVGFDFDSAAGQQTRADLAAAGAGKPTVPGACIAASCSSSELAGAELDELKRAVARQFPTGRVRICRDARMWEGGRLRWSCAGGADAPVVIKIGWRGKNPDGTPRTFGESELAPGVAIAVASTTGAAP